MPYANPEDKRARSKKHYAENAEYYKRKMRRNRNNRPRLHAYLGQKHTAKQRGVEFNLTYEEWIEWWGDDFEKRGRTKNRLQMCRYGDTGAYEIGNIYKATQRENDSGPRFKEK